MNFVGIDHSLTAPGIANIIRNAHGDLLYVRTVRTGKDKGFNRQRAIIDEVLKACSLPDTIVAMEGHSYGHNQRGSRERTELVGVIKWELSNDGIPWTQDITPSMLRKYVVGHAGGRGEEGKRQMIAAVAQMGVSVIDDNQADAYGLARILFDTYQLAIKGVRPATLYQYEVCEGLSEWVREQVNQRGA